MPPSTEQIIMQHLPTIKRLHVTDRATTSGFIAAVSYMSSTPAEWEQTYGNVASFRFRTQHRCLYSESVHYKAEAAKTVARLPPPKGYYLRTDLRNAHGIIAREGCLLSCETSACVPTAEGDSWLHAPFDAETARTAVPAPQASKVRQGSEFAKFC